MKILYLAHRIPYPPNKGDKIRSFHEVKYLSQRHDIHLLAFYDQPSDAAHAAELRRYCRSVTLVYLNRRIQMLRALAAMLRGDPWSLGFFDSRAMRSAVAKILDMERIDVALGFSSSMAPYIAQLPCRRVLDFVDSDASKWHQYSRMMGMPKRLLYNYESLRLSAFELRMIRELDASVFVSPREVSWIEKSSSRPYCPDLAGKLHFIPNGIDLDYYRPAAAPAADPTIVFTGAMDYFPNVDGARFFARSVLPLVRRQVPSARFLVVGSNPVPSVRRLGDIGGVTVTGTVPDVRPFMAKAKVAAVPLRISQGVQNKVLEALAVGLPVVTTPQVAAGLYFQELLPIAVGADPEQIADHIARNLVAHATPQAHLEKTRILLRQNYNWEANLAKLESLLSQEAIPA